LEPIFSIRAWLHISCVGCVRPAVFFSCTHHLFKEGGGDADEAEIDLIKLNSRNSLRAFEKPVIKGFSKLFFSNKFETFDMRPHSAFFFQKKTFLSPWMSVMMRSIEMRHSSRPKSIRHSFPVVATATKPAHCAAPQRGSDSG
jgi:hypothetical protein